MEFCSANKIISFLRHTVVAFHKSQANNKDSFLRVLSERGVHVTVKEKDDITHIEIT